MIFCLFKEATSKGKSKKRMRKQKKVISQNLDAYLGIVAATLRYCDDTGSQTMSSDFVKFVLI